MEVESKQYIKGKCEWKQIAVKFLTACGLSKGQQYN